KRIRRTQQGIMRSDRAAIPRISSFGTQPTKVPSHYSFLLITQLMASSPLLEPAGHVRGLILDDCGCNAGFRAKVGGSHFRAQFFF
ncbi:MAG: hypothetical protein WBQ86_14395, partial [Candidatus Binatus sp.]